MIGPELRVQAAYGLRLGGHDLKERVVALFEQHQGGWIVLKFKIPRPFVERLPHKVVNSFTN